MMTALSLFVLTCARRFRRSTYRAALRGTEFPEALRK
jgi:hypothetical protein